MVGPGRAPTPYHRQLSSGPTVVVRNGFLDLAQALPDDDAVVRGAPTGILCRTALLRPSRYGSAKFGPGSASPRLDSNIVVLGSVKCGLDDHALAAFDHMATKFGLDSTIFLLHSMECGFDSRDLGLQGVADHSKRRAWGGRCDAPFREGQIHAVRERACCRVAREGS